jgi:hypothetical protein
LRVFEIVQKIITNIIPDPFEIEFKVLKKINIMIQGIFMDNTAERNRFGIKLEDHYTRSILNP